MTLREVYPLHTLVWENSVEILDATLRESRDKLEQKDSHGRTPLLLATAMKRLDCVRVLLQHGADVQATDPEAFSCLHYATSLNSDALMNMILKHRRTLLKEESENRIPQLLSILDQSKDFYIEMNWNFSSWIPLVSRFCPSDTYRIWKRGPYVRVDTTLLGFSNMTWERGHRSYLFKANPKSDYELTFEVVEVDHDQKVARVDSIGGRKGQNYELPLGHEIATRLDKPVVSTRMEAENVKFSRARTGIWGFQSDKTEEVNGYQAAVYDVKGIQIVTRTRYEHLPKNHPSRKKVKTPINRVVGLMGGGGQEEENSEDSEANLMLPGGEGSADLVIHDAKRGSNLSLVEYLEEPASLENDLPFPREMRTQTQSFTATVALCDSFPLSFQQQILPIIDLLAPTSVHAAKLKDFLSIQLPPGFPIKVEIPVYHVAKAIVTFANFSPCEKAEDLFEIPASFAVIGNNDHHLSLRADNDFFYLQGEAGIGDDEVDPDLALALRLSKEEATRANPPDGPPDAEDDDAAPSAPRGLDSSPPTPRVGLSEWACPVCTFENAALSLSCEMCATTRPPMHEQQQGGHSPSRPSQLDARPSADELDPDVALAISLSLQDG